MMIKGGKTRAKQKEKYFCGKMFLFFQRKCEIEITEIIRVLKAYESVGKKKGKKLKAPDHRWI